MSKINLLEELYRELKSMLEKHGKHEVDPQIFRIDNIITFLSKLDKTNIDPQAFEELKRMHNALYPPRGGLSDFFIWSNDFEERVRLNESLDRVQNEIWHILNDN